MYRIRPFEFHYFSLDNIVEKKIFSKDEILIKEGEFVYITGPSGAGKSTVLSLLKGLMPQYIAGTLIGDILYQNLPLNDEHFKNNLQDIIYLFQNPFSWAIHQNTDDEFYFAMENFKFSQKSMLAKKSELEELFELRKIWNRKTSELSHGECQKLALASLVAIGPKVLLLDEPCAFLDSEARSKFYQLLHSLRGKFTIVIVDHHTSEIPNPDKVLKVSSTGELRQEIGKNYLVDNFKEKEMTPTIHFNKSLSHRIEISQLSFSYNSERQVLKNLNLSLESGDVAIVTGKNGEGKSTLLKLLAGIIKPTSGIIDLFIDGKKLKKFVGDKHISFIFQNPESHFCFDSIKEELEFNLDDGQKKQLFKLSDHMLKGVNLNKSPFMLSEGQKRRLSILITLMQNKDIIFMDEPTFGQDPKSIRAIVDIIKDIKQSGKILLIISHDKEFSSQVATKHYHLENGFLKVLQ